MAKLRRCMKAQLTRLLSLDAKDAPEELQDNVQKMKEASVAGKLSLSKQTPQKRNSDKILDGSFYFTVKPGYKGSRETYLTAYKSDPLIPIQFYFFSLKDPVKGHLKIPSGQKTLNQY